MPIYPELTEKVKHDCDSIQCTLKRHVCRGAMNVMLTFTLCMLLKIYLMRERELIFCNSGDAIKVLV